MENDEETFSVFLFSLPVSVCLPPHWEVGIGLQQGNNGRYFIRGESSVC